MAEKKKTFAVVGGDQRSAHLANTLAYRESGWEIYALFLEKDVKLASSIHASGDYKSVLPVCDIVIFPLPLLDGAGNISMPLSDSQLTLNECMEYISPSATVLAGKVPAAFAPPIIDYLEREELAIFNAVLTAEGAVEIALRELPISLFGSTCTVTGFGRIAKVLARLLAAFGAEVRVVARNCEDLAWIRAMGYEAVPTRRMTDALRGAHVLFNTVPSVILGDDKLKKLDRGCLVIDLASRPGGVDFEAAEALGLKTIWALSLPGKVAPVTAGEMVLDTIFNILNERCDLQ